MNVRHRIHFVVVVVFDVVFFFLFFSFFFTDVNIYHPALFLTTLDSFAIAVNRAHVIFSRVQVTSPGGPFLISPDNF